MNLNLIRFQMNMILPFSLVIIGFVALIYGANWLVNGASSLAKKYKVSDLVIGLTIVAFGTSAPELVVNFIVSYCGSKINYSSRNSYFVICSHCFYAFSKRLFCGFQ